MNFAQSADANDFALGAAATPLLQRFEAFYQRFSEASFDDIGAIYEESVRFVDPVHELEGLASLTPYLQKSLDNVRFCYFEFQNRVIGESEVSYVWCMRFAHSKLNDGAEIEVPGMSYLRFDEKVLYHRDFYDMGAMVYEHVPVMRWGVQVIKNRIAS